MSGTELGLRKVWQLGFAIDDLLNNSGACPVIHALCVDPRNASAVEFDLSKSFADIC